MSLVAKSLLRFGHNCFIYADDMVIYSSNKSLHLAIELLNVALKDLNTILFNVSLGIAPEKCKSVIFTRRRLFDPPNRQVIDGFKYGADLLVLMFDHTLKVAYSRLHVWLLIFAGARCSQHGIELWAWL